MFQNNPLLAQLKQQIRETLPIKEGVVKGTSKGFGFLEVSEKESFFIPPPHMKKVMHGDHITAVVRTENDRELVEPETLIEAGVTRFVARVKWFRDRLNIVPDHPLMKDAIKARAIKGLDEKSLKEGDWVLGELTRHALKDNNGFFASVVEVIAGVDDPIAPWWVVLARNKLANQAPADHKEWQTVEESLPRRDLTDVPFFTIDGESTLDMDDALSVKKLDNGWELLVAIADPTAYVAHNSDMDKVAAERAFTVYLPGRNIPMLPRTLADELCSLQEGVNRSALCARLFIDNDGKVDDEAEFFAATIRSQARLSYDQVSDWVEQIGDWQPANEVIAEQLRDLTTLTHTRSAWRSKHAIVFKDRPDYRFALDENSSVTAILVDYRRIANQMVEEAMIAANLACGNWLNKHVGTGIFNVHAGFDSEKMEGLVELLQAHEAPFEPESVTSLEGFCALRRWLDERETTYLDSRTRRYQSFAAMSATPGAHFGLGLTAYATWTSPIRKYGDIVNHRLIKAILAEQAHDAFVPSDELAVHLSEQRRMHRRAERDIADWLYVRYLQPAVAEGKVFDAEVIDIGRGGVKLRLQENGAVVFMPSSLILANRDRLECSWDDGRVYLDKAPLYELGQAVQVIITEAIEDTRSLIAKPAQPIAPVAPQ
ncbi:exoribonuclease 2 [Oceanisphaera marina]|uniref:Exoribonuclease 2 n=1 Tax=Oceanisphaera marina TaxID=2017550 RepID=A0ABQ1IQW2_9GAMM|nr:exoribonuclease II [Oceanisphaera marina]GGB50368.1 exoribonuclease 2 [Oceanisphaera marina]